MCAPRVIFKTQYIYSLFALGGSTLPLLLDVQSRERLALQEVDVVAQVGDDLIAARAVEPTRRFGVAAKVYRTAPIATSCDAYREKKKRGTVE